MLINTLGKFISENHMVIFPKIFSGDTSVGKLTPTKKGLCYNRFIEFLIHRPNSRKTVMVCKNHAQNRRDNRNVVKVKSKKRVVVVPKRGLKVKVAPKGSVIVPYRDVPYKFHRGVFYRPVGKSYVIVAPPHGIHVSTLPLGYKPLLVRGRHYYYYQGTFYQPAGESYEVVQAPLGALLEELPEGSENLTIDGESYYVFDQVQYKAVIHNGEIWYEVIKYG